ncbi:MAG: CaiB/BaiF CoA-transferase family protein [Gammaproteobacteria bacterium]|jgi:formyl-CoA transferase|nr:carnitine dehydratase [Gammaproteobacteria bacterium]MDP6096714.1 CaiB/BaiF CoA-transferase family protein [Gammaproteobacteria bacterium]|tara:strand:+ start:347 stop:1555 length:1209 start_codon:yes stop_codon:yes gene_type:complete
MADTNQAGGALAGKLVIDLTRVLGGPYCTQILADHGAEVVKIEPPRGDETRDWGPPFHEGDAAYFLGVNRNKRSMGLDLTNDSGREVLLRVLENADVLIENYKPGTMEKWNLGYEEVLKHKFPSLIHCRVSGFGADGPFGGFPGYDAIIQAMAGWFSVNGEAGSNPTRLGLAMVDMGTGLYSAIAILMAIVEREKSGQGQYLDMALYDCAVSLMHPHIVNYNFSGKVPVATGNAHPNISPYDTYRTKTVDIFIGAGNNRAYAKLCNELDRPDLIDDARFINNIDRVNNRGELKVEMESAMMKIDGSEIADRLAQAGLAAGPIHDTAQVVAHPHTIHREMSIEEDWYKMTGTPIKLSRTPGSIRRKPPKYGEHTSELLSSFGFSDEEIGRLLEAKVVLDKRQG